MLCALIAGGEGLFEQLANGKSTHALVRQTALCSCVGQT